MVYWTGRAEEEEEALPFPPYSHRFVWTASSPFHGQGKEGYILQNDQGRGRAQNQFSPL